ncbi:MAG: ATP-binding protein, partial [Rhodospirillaceae bacterium]|nr:ATP-binding protein [Rhodospirillaceae bacterium]
MSALEITILSGKGGTGKTSVSAAFVRLAKQAVICDLDVDASDLPLLLTPDVQETHVFESGFVAELDPALCRNCGRCLTWCRFDAFSEGPDGIIELDQSRCEGCGVCAHFCRPGALVMQPRVCGAWYQSETDFGPMMHARLNPGEENSGKLISLLRQEATRLAVDRGMSLILGDGPPGIGCPAISAVGGTDYVVLVTEPTPSGVSDLGRVAGLCAHFDRPAGIIINKADLDSARVAEIEDMAASRGMPILAYIPFANGAMRALVEGRSLLDVPETAPALVAAW